MTEEANPKNDGYFFVGLVIGAAVFGVLMMAVDMAGGFGKRVSKDQYDLINRFGFGFKDLWNLEKGRQYQIELKDGKYSKYYFISERQ
jgi:hypothetical protein